MELDAARAAITYHSTATQAAEIAKLVNAKSLILGHFSSRYTDLQPMLLEAKSVFPEAELSEEGQSYRV